MVLKFKISHPICLLSFNHQLMKKYDFIQKKRKLLNSFLFEKWMSIATDEATYYSDMPICINPLF